jgi:plasmid stabilization system protein ParE
MPSRDLRFTPLAARDVREAVAWYDEQRTGLGAEFEAALHAALVLLRQAPEAGPPVLRDVRRVLLPRFPYALYYRLTPDLLEIRACLHQHRHPRLWRRRA